MSRMHEKDLRSSFPVFLISYLTVMESQKHVGGMISGKLESYFSGLIHAFPTYRAKLFHFWTYLDIFSINKGFLASQDHVGGIRKGISTPVLGSGDAWKITSVLNITFSRFIAVCGQGFLPFLGI